GRWYFNKAFPKELWPITGKAPFRLSLRTDSLELAQRRRADAERRYWAFVDEARAKLGEAVPRPLSEIEAVAIVSRWFAERNGELEHDHLHEPSPPELIEDNIASAEYVIGDLNRRLGRGDLTDYRELA